MRRLPLLFLLALLALVALAAPASAHTELLQTQPSPGATTQTDLRAVTLTFTREVDPRLATVTVTGADGEVVSSGSPRRDGATLVQPLAAVGAGRYRVQWRASAADGHILDGTFGFRVGTPAVADAGAAGNDSEKLSPAELLLQHAQGDYDHDQAPSYALTDADRSASRKAAQAVVPAPAPTPTPAPAPAPTPTPDNGGAMMVTLLIAAAGVTTVTAVAEGVRAHRV